MKKLGKKTLVLLLTLLIICTIGTLSAYAAAPAGEGTEENPYQITSEEDLIWFSQLVDAELTDTAQNTDAWAVLTNDIELTQGWNPIGDEYTFKGNFDGKGYTISGLDINIANSSGNVFAGLFGYNEGTIKNVNVEGSITVTGNGGYVDAAGISGRNDGTIESCSSNVTINVEGQFDAYIGGIAGYNVGSIISCENNGDISVDDVPCYAMAGGICGQNGSGGRIESCSNNGNISVTVEGTSAGDYALAGGICGLNYGTVASSDNSGAVTGTVTSSDELDYAFVGGICGWNYTDAETVKCRNSGTVTGDINPAKNNSDYGYVGGICGRNEHKGTIDQCHNSGEVTSSSRYANIGGICGGNFRNDKAPTEEGKIMDCVNSGAITGTGTGCNIGGICGINYASIESCSNFSIVTGNGKVGAVCGWQYVGTGVKGSYFCSEMTSKGIGYHNYGTKEAMGKTSDAYASGEVAWLLGSAWEQELGTAQFPTTIMTTEGETYEVVKITVQFSDETADAICYANEGQLLSDYPNSDAYVFFEEDSHTTWIDPETKTYVEDTTIYALKTTTPVEGVNLNKNSITLYVNENEKLTATVTPDTATYTGVKWVSNNENVATVDQEGNVTAIAKGTAVITAAAVDGSDAYAQCNVIVKSKSSGGGFVQQRTLTFDTNGGSKIDAVTANYGKTIVLADYTPKRTGYDFVGWYKDKELTEKIEYAILDYDMTVYAKWAANGEPTEDGDYDTKIILVINDKTAVVNGKAVTNDVAPLIVNGRTYTPARFVAEALGAKVDWNEATRTVTITKDDTNIVLLVDSSAAYVNGKAVKMDAAAFIADSRIYTPSRFVAENLGATVEWDEETRTVTIWQ